MSWNAYLIDDRGHYEGDWNYTSNCNGMINVALTEAGIKLPPDTTPCSWLDRSTGEWHDAPNGHGPVSWWQHLGGMSGPDGARYLDLIVRGLEADPARFEAMNPANGWGDRDSLVKLLTEMRDAVPEWPTAWSTSG